MASSRLVLPEPVGPWMRKSPSAERASTSTTTRSANGPNAAHVAEEVAADLDVGCGRDARGVRPQRHRGALRVEAQLEGEREPAAHLLHRPERSLRVGEGDLAPGDLRAV